MNDNRLTEIMGEIVEIWSWRVMLVIVGALTVRVMYALAVMR